MENINVLIINNKELDDLRRSTVVAMMAMDATKMPLDIAMANRADMKKITTRDELERLKKEINKALDQAFTLEMQIKTGVLRITKKDVTITEIRIEIKE